MSCHKCGSAVSTGKEGLKGSWCVDCGEKVFSVDDRECKDCESFFSRPFYSGCSKHLMRVSPDMNVTYPTNEGSCFKLKLNTKED